MLVLSRKVGESIVLPACGAIVTVVRVTGKKVRLGVTAPAEVTVHREETWDRIVAAPHNGVAVLDHARERVRVLVAAPDTRFLQQCRSLACRGRLDVAVARDGDACIEQLVVFQPHLLILDVHLPPEGAAMTTMVAMSKRRDASATPVIILGGGTENQGFGGFNPPIIDRLPGPVTQEQIEQRIAAFIDRPPAAMEHVPSSP